MGEDANLSTDETEVVIPEVPTTPVEAPPAAEGEKPPVNEEVEGEKETIGEEPPVRKEEESRIGYAKRQEEKLKKEAEAPPAPPVEPVVPVVPTSAPSDVELVKDVLQNELGMDIEGLKASQHAQKVEREIAELVKDLPEMAEHEDKIRAWANHPSRANSTVKGVAGEIVGLNAMMALGAKREQEAVKEANQTKPVGSTISAAKKDPKEMTATEVRAERQRILSGQ